MVRMARLATVLRCYVNHSLCITIYTFIMCIHYRFFPSKFDLYLYFVVSSDHRPSNPIPIPSHPAVPSHPIYTIPVVRTIFTVVDYHSISSNGGFYLFRGYSHRLQYGQASGDLRLRKFYRTNVQLW